jgi:rod shape-determining protein MreB
VSADIAMRHCAGRRRRSHQNLDRECENGLPVTLAENPLSCVVLGKGKMLSDFALLKRIAIN